jgi:hypothetical protein
MEKAVFIAVACIVTDLMGVTAVLAITFASTDDIPIILAIQLPIGVLLVPGLLRGNRFAWECGRAVGIANSLFLFDHSFISPDWWMPNPTTLRMYGLLNYLLFCSLYSEGARRHFRLICPHCASKSTRAKDLLSRRMRCSDCETIW